MRENLGERVFQNIKIQNQFMELLNFKIKNINGSKLFEILGMEDAGMFRYMLSKRVK